MAIAPEPNDVGLYVHVSFCKTKCFYCDFNTYAGLGYLISPYVEALRAEIQGLPHQLPDTSQLPGDFRIGSIFFGGGTPSLLAPEQVASILEAARHWPATDDAEVTLEANPDDVSRDYLREIRASGINRLSMGVQTFDEALLRRLGRRHDVETAVRAFQDARAAGFDNLSFDLMFALPGQSLQQWNDTLDQAIALEPDHLSLYNLQIEPGTPFHTWVARGKLSVPDDDESADFYQLAIDRLGAAGFRHYEVSNWAKQAPDRDLRGQHNLRYWRNESYFGVGAGAHSGYADYRYANTRLPVAYIKQARAGESTIESHEHIARDVSMGETMMLGLRLDEGIDPRAFQARYGQTPGDVYGATLDELQAAGVLTADDTRIALTPRGRFVGNEVFYRFLP